MEDRSAPEGTQQHCLGGHQVAVAGRDSGRGCVWPGVTRGWVKGVFKENWFVGREVNRKPGESEGLGLGPPAAVLPPAPHC